MNLRKIFLFVALFSIIKSLNAQSIMLTQFEQSPLNLNPSLTGLFNGKVRILSNFKSYNSKTLDLIEYSTFTSTVDKTFKVGKNYIGIGLSNQIDRLHNYFAQNTRTGFSLSFIKQIGNKHLLSVGQNSSFTNRKFNPSPEVVQALQGNQSIKDNLSFIDLSLGAHLNTKFSRMSNLNFGVTFRNVNKPDISLFNETTNELPIGVLLHAGGELSIMENQSITANVLTERNTKNILQYGFGIKLYHSESLESNYLHFRLNFRKSEKDFSDIIVIVQGMIKSINIGLSYEIIPLMNVSYFNESVFEVSLGYRIGQNNKFKILQY